LVKQKIKLVFILRNIAGKSAMFFAQGVGVIKSIGFQIKDIAVSAVAISFMTLLADGSINLTYPLKNGSGL
jgi:hypothetical protein